MNISRARRHFGHLSLAAVLGLSVLPLKADVVELINGDRYQGTVVSMTDGFLDFQSEIQGRVKLPREKVAAITLHHSAAPKTANKGVTSPAMATPSLPLGNNGGGATAPASQADAVVQQMRREGVDPKMINQVQEQIFGQSSPEATQKFNQTMAGLISGKLSIGDIRVQAQTSINEIKDAKKELGGDAGEMLDGYLAILEKFVQQTGGGDAGSVSIPPTPEVTSKPPAAQSPAN